MGRIVRLTERDLSKLVRRVINEKEGGTQDLPTCKSLMVTDSRPGGGSVMTGTYTKIFRRGAVAPQYQGYVVSDANGEFCFIPDNPTSSGKAR
jgi:hypothetical protein